MLPEDRLAAKEPLAESASADGGRETTPSLVRGAAEEPLRNMVARSLERYFALLDGETPQDVYALVLAEVEAPLLETVMHHAGGNQSRAAEILGLNRGTLRKKLRQYGLLVAEKS